MKKLLIANRGEIATRIAATARRMGIQTVAIYHSEDGGLPFVRLADEAVCLGDGSLTETYLNAHRIVAIAQSVGADSIHPGYGFLSENAAFAQLCGQSGITFVGPSPEVIALMGDKTASRQYAQSLGIPVVHGYQGHPHEILQQVQPDDFPLLVKPAHGGGGKGMKVASNFVELEQMLGSASREALRYFGSDIVFVEQLVLLPRHIEVQLVGDSLGNVLHLHDRECTLQRRFQKVVEEAPSPSLTPEQRKQAFDMAVRMAQECGYQNAGTVEFLLDSKGKLLFLEMNTRLQVEHPVSEAITGLDMVELQLLVAQGKPLPVRQTDITVNGHAIELRLIAEDAQNGFMPSVGTILQLAIPKNIRFDGGYEQGCMVTPHFDSLVGKMVVHAPSREQAIARSVEAVEASSLLGLSSNLPFLRQLLLSKSFRENKIHTDFIDRSLAEMVESIRAFKVAVPPHLLLAAYLSAQRQVSPLNAWLLFNSSTVLVDGMALRYYSNRTQQGYFIAVNGVSMPVEVRIDGSTIHVAADGIEALFHHAHLGDEVLLSHKGVDWSIRPLAAQPEVYKPEKQLSDYERAIVSPLNGKIVEVNVVKGQQVAKGTLLLVLESMKMENSIFAPADATVGDVFVQVAQQVVGGSTMIRLV